MNVALIIPPSGFQLDDRVYPMLGVLKVAAALERAGVTVRVLDLSGSPFKPGGMTLYRHGYRHGWPDVWGISATMPQMPVAAEIAKDIRRLPGSPKIVLGGAHPTMVNAAAKLGVARSQRMLDDLRGVFDHVVAGDGERAIFEIFKPDAPFLIDADNPPTRAGEVTLFLSKTEVEEAPFPSRHLIDVHSYHHWVDGEASTSVIAQLGCPMGCKFCGGRNSATYRRVRQRSPESIVAELSHIRDRFGYKAFMFLDDELNINNRVYIETLKGIKAEQDRRGESWRLCGLLKSELFTQEQADLMYAAGFRKILVGFESGHDRILRNMKKGCTVEDNTAAVRIAHNAGLKIKALMSLGHPGESADTIAATQQWLEAVRPDEFDATVLTIYPGTPYHDEAVDAHGWWTYTAQPSGDRLHFFDIDQFTDMPYYKGIPGEYRSYVWTDHLAPTELVRLRDNLETDVRTSLGIAWPKSAAEINFEHSMGQ